MTALYATRDVAAERAHAAERILGASAQHCGSTNEAQMDVVTAVSGSGPAYFFLLIEMLEASRRRSSACRPR